MTVDCLTTLIRPWSLHVLLANKHYYRAIKVDELDRMYSLHGRANKFMQNLDRNIWKEEATWDIVVYV